MKRYADGRSEMVTSLHDERLERVIHALLEANSGSVLDLGCGPGELMARLAAERRFTRIAGIDTSLEALAEARHLLTAEDCVWDDTRLSLHHASFTTHIEDLAGFDAAVMVETIEHVDPHRLSAVEKTVFAGYRPQTVLVTTPNSEYNVLHGIPDGTFRHRDHRFEWTRSKFRKWAEGVAGRHGYRTVFDDIGPVDPALGSSTQMAIFSRISNGLWD
jgi:3' terminal RNA ribose 2'-O-methyltransferase Hen1